MVIKVDISFLSTEYVRKIKRHKLQIYFRSSFESKKFKSYSWHTILKLTTTAATMIEVTEEDNAK